MTNPAQIAARLTKAQRDAVIDTRETFLYGRQKCKGKMKSLRILGLTDEAMRGGDLLTDLGLQVRAILEEQTDVE